MIVPDLPRCRLWAIMLLAAAQPAMSQTGNPPESAARPRSVLSLELNKLEPAPNLCRAYFVAENRMQAPVQELRLDTFIFDKAGIVTRRVGLTFPDLRPGRAKVVPFDFAGANCAEIGKLLVNDVLACIGSAGAPIPGCAESLAVSTRAPAEFSY